MAMPRGEPAQLPLTGKEILRLIQSGKVVLAPASALRGLQGNPGSPGKDGLPGKDGTNGIDGRNGVDGKDGAPGTIIQRTRVTTNAQGVATWTFPAPYPAGTLPVITALVQDTTADLISVKATALTNTSVTLRASKPALVLAVLNINAAASVTIHLQASPP